MRRLTFLLLALLWVAPAWATEQFANNIATTLNGAINNSVTTVVVTSATGMPSSGTFRAIVDNEIMLVTARSGTSLTVTRGSEGTTAASHSNGAAITIVLTAAAMTQFGADLVGPAGYTIHAGTGTLAAALAACPASGNLPCTIVADGGQTYTVSSPLILGNGGYPQTLVVDGATINCTSTSIDVCIELTDQGRIVGTTYLKGTTNTGSLIKADASSNLQAVVSSESGPTGDAQTHFDVENINIQGNTSASLSKAVLWVSGICGLGTVRNVTISGVPAAAGNGILIDDSPNSAAGCTNVVDLDTIWVALGNVALAGNGLKITSAKGGTSDIECKTCAIVDSTGTGAMIQIDTTGSTQTNTVNFNNLYLEVKAGFTGDVFLINNARNITATGVLLNHNGSPTFTNAIHIQNANTDQVIMTGRANGSLGATNVLKNDVTGFANTTLGAFDYHLMKSGQGTLPAYDGLGITAKTFGPAIYYSAAGTAITGCSSTLARQYACVSDSTACTSGTTYTSGGSTACLLQCNNAGTAWKETGVSCF